jgi:hypothetical protein
MIEVVVRNSPLSKGPIFYYEPSIVTFVGELLVNPKHVADDCITLSRNDFIPYRVIPKRDIISMDGEPAVTEPSTKSTQTWNVSGSKGNPYIVTRSHNHWSCTCSGFSFRRDCKHIREKKNV